MHTFKKYDGVTFDDSGRINHGTIESIENGRATLYYYHLDFPWNADHITLPLDKLEFVPPTSNLIKELVHVSDLRNSKIYYFDFVGIFILSIRYLHKLLAHFCTSFSLKSCLIFYAG